MAKTLQQQTYDSRIRQLSKYDSIITPDELDSIHLETTESEFKKILDSLKIRIAKEVPAIQKSPNAEISDQLKKFNYFNFIPKFDEDDDFIRITDEEKSFKEYLKLLHSLPKNKLMDFVEYKANGIFIWRVNQY